MATNDTCQQPRYVRWTVTSSQLSPPGVDVSPQTGLEGELRKLELNLEKLIRSIEFDLERKANLEKLIEQHRQMIAKT